MIELADQWHCTIPLAPVSMKNSRVAIIRDGKPAFVKSMEAQSYMKTACLWLNAGRPDVPFSENDRLRLTCVVRYPWPVRPQWVRDVDVSIVCDALEESGVIPNDKQIRELSVKATDDHGEPFTQITLEVVGEVFWANGGLKR